MQVQNVYTITSIRTIIVTSTQQYFRATKMSQNLIKHARTNISKQDLGLSTEMDLSPEVIVFEYFIIANCVVNW